MKEILINKLDAILFYLAEPVEVGFLAKTLEVSKAEVVKAVEELQKKLENCGVRIMFHNDEVSMVTAPELSETIEKIVKEERERELGRAGVETLAIVAYKGPVSRKEIDYIRGVNSQFALRNLLLRGLVERKARPQTPERSDGGRGSDPSTSSGQGRQVMVYTLTTDALRHLGIGKINKLPEYGEIQKQVEIMPEDENES